MNSNPKPMIMVVLPSAPAWGTISDPESLGWAIGGFPPYNALFSSFATLNTIVLLAAISIASPVPG